MASKAQQQRHRQRVAIIELLARIARDEAEPKTDNDGGPHDRGRDEADLVP